MHSKSLGFVGLGSIGLPVVLNFVSAGYSLRLHTRNSKIEKDPRLTDSKFFSSPKDAAKGCDVFFLCLTDDQAVEEVLFGLNGACESLKRGCKIIDFSTISPSKARAVSKRLLKKEIFYLDAPVSGGTEGAKEAKLTIFLGCDNKQLKEIQSLLEIISSNVFCFGEVGKGQEVKALNQILVAGSYAALAEAIALGETLNLPMNLVVNSLKTGAAGSWALSHRSEGMLSNRYPLGFKLGLHYKDLSIALKTAKESGLCLPITSKVKEMEKQLIEQGYGDYDVSVLKKCIIRDF